ncbi:hypothetical protein BD769DRAFT_1392271 [Suillus cothurnatus]|nr:hypothetical protein BD769DRAFT_1392271 [Suillus cothurnatus]
MPHGVFTGMALSTLCDCFRGAHLLARKAHGSDNLGSNKLPNIKRSKQDEDGEEKGKELENRGGSWTGKMRVGALGLYACSLEGPRTKIDTYDKDRKNESLSTLDVSSVSRAAGIDSEDIQQ